MKWIFLMGLWWLAACGGPSPHFRNSPVTRVVVGDAQFDVRVRGNIAESIRKNVQYAPRLGRLAGKAAIAMHQVSGCKVEHVLGDASVQLGLLNCGPGAPDWASILRRGTGQYDCIEVDQWPVGRSGDFYLEFECDRY